MRSLLVAFAFALALGAGARPAFAAGCGCHRACRVEKAECRSRCDSPGMPGRKPCLIGCAQRAKSCKDRCGACVPAPNNRKKLLDERDEQREPQRRKWKSHRSQYRHASQPRRTPGPPVKTSENECPGG